MNKVPGFNKPTQVRDPETNFHQLGGISAPIHMNIISVDRTELAWEQYKY